MRVPLSLARLTHEFIIARAGEKPPASVRAIDMIEWLALVDENSSPRAKATVARMYRVMVGRRGDFGTEERIRQALDAVDFEMPDGTPLGHWGSLREYVARCDRDRREPGDGAGVRYVNALHRVGLTDCMVRVTNDLATTVARGLAPVRGRPSTKRTKERGLHVTVDDELAEALSALLGEPVSAHMAKKWRPARKRREA